MKKLKGPDLKLPTPRLPLFLVDLYYDLRDRRLLPLVLLAVVAIAAAPFLLSGSSDEQPPPVAADGAAGGAPSSPGSELTVVRSAPGLRDYRKRLRRRSATDPFKQRYTAPRLAGARLPIEGGGGGPSTSTTTKVTSTSTVTDTSRTTKTTETVNGTTTKKATSEATGPPVSQGQAGGGGGAAAGPGGQGPAPGSTFYAFAIDLRIKRTVTTPDGKTESDDPVTRENLLGAVALPSEKTQVVAYIGASPRTRKPLFMISSDVTAVYGEGKCLSGASACQLMEVEAGMPVTFVYGPDGARYKFTVLKVEPVVTGHS